MEQSIDDGNAVTDEDMEVASILLELPHLIFQSQSRNRSAFTSWLSKRKRSLRGNVIAAVSSPTPSPSPSPSPLPQPPSLPSNAVASTSSSPATPLSFSPSESDEKDKPLQPSNRKSHGNYLKKKKEQLVEIVEEFTLRNEFLKKEIESKKRFHDQLKAENLELKAKKKKWYHNLPEPKARDPNLETNTGKSLNLGTRIFMEIQRTSNCDNNHHHKKLMMYDDDDQTVDNHNPGMNPMGGMICLGKLQNDNVGPIGLIDLNVSAVEAAKARAAEARFKRKQIYRSKNYNAAYKARFPS